jgi:hypothetical chaperone protein
LLFPAGDRIARFVRCASRKEPFVIIGMDFGTTNSGIAVYDGQRLRLIPLGNASSGATIARTALYLTNDRQVYIGRHAIDTYYEQNLNRPVRIEKVCVGEIELTFAELPTHRRFVYLDKDVLAPGRLFLSFKTALSSLNYLGTVVGSHFYFLEDIIALYLYIARQRAENALGAPISRIVLGRPVRYTRDPEGDRLAQERFLKAAFRAGYDEVYLQYEPVAAAYHYESTIQGEQNVLIFDFGGGTLDISILRVGNPHTRAVLANGGLPIAGDVFDQKLVRARLPPHFGEGSAYGEGGKLLPVPSSFYEAFANWQDMLALNRPHFFESIRRIENTAQRPHQIRALRQLIASSYGLRMFDTVEAVKRELSDNTQSVIRLDGEGFTVRELVTRAEFERIIRAEIMEIDAYIDDMLAQAGLKAGQIDVVIRTGGSSQIPAFVHMLERRFGRDKIRSLDTFSSVTSGLGLIAHEIETGQISVPAYHSRDYQMAHTSARDGVPAVDFEMMKKYVTFTENQASDQPPAAGWVVCTRDHDVVGVLGADPAALPLAQAAQVMAAPADTPLLLCTSDYRFTLKTPRQLASLRYLGLSLAASEGFQTDVFGDEHVTGLMNWGDFEAAEWALLVTRSGHYRSFQAGPLFSRIEQPVPYQIPRLKGHPLRFIERPQSGEALLFSSAGRAVRLPAAHIAPLEGRLMNVTPREAVIAAFTLPQPGDFILASASGQLRCLASGDIPPAPSLNTPGSRVIPWRALQAVHPAIPHLYAATTQRLLVIDEADIQRGRLRLTSSESLVSLLRLA